MATYYCQDPRDGKTYPSTAPCPPGLTMVPTGLSLGPITNTTPVAGGIVTAASGVHQTITGIQQGISNLQNLPGQVQSTVQNTLSSIKPIQAVSSGEFWHSTGLLAGAVLLFVLGAAFYLKGEGI